MRTPIVVAAGVAALAIGAAGCGGSSGAGGGQAAKSVDPTAAEVNPAGDIPDNQAYVAYTPPGAGYSVKVPEGWARTSAGGAVTFTDKLNSIRLDSMPAQAAPTGAQAKRVEVPKLAKTVKGFAAAQVSTVDRQAGKAVLVTYLADANTDAVTGKSGQDAVERYAFFHQGTEAVLTLSGPKGADNVDPWKIVTDSLRWSR